MSTASNALALVPVEARPEPTSRRLRLAESPPPLPGPADVGRPPRHLEGLHDDLADRGWVHLPGVGWEGLGDVEATLGAEVLLTTDVRVRPGMALVTSDRALDFHTDHHRADAVAWLCLRQTSEGGETLLADGVAALVSLPPAQQERLARLRLFEHSVFPGDPKTHPVVERVDGRPRLYCSFWFDVPPAPADEAALEALRASVLRHRVASLRLAPGDVLVIDNRRILHARTAIVGSRDRHLVRHWLAVPRGA